MKMACGDKRISSSGNSRPSLTVTQPQRVTAPTGIDALAHAIETYVTSRAAISLAFSREAWRHLCAEFSGMLDEPGNLTARAEMQLGACLAGLAIENQCCAPMTSPTRSPPHTELSMVRQSR